MTKWLLLGALLSSPAGCAPMPSTASPRGAPPRVLLTFRRTGGFVVQSGHHKLVLFEDGRLQYEGRRAFGNPDWDEVPIAPPAMARVRSSLERLSALSPDCCNCSNATDQSWVFMTFQVAGGTDVRKIDHYMGCYKTPDWLYDVENEIDDALGTERWVGHKVVGKPLHMHQQGPPPRDL